LYQKIKFKTCSPIQVVWQQTRIHLIFDFHLPSILLLQSRITHRPGCSKSCVRNC
jgi:hypothetical protein